MKQQSKQIIIDSVLLFFSLLLSAILLKHSFDFPDHSYFYKPEYFNPYTNVNVINGFVNFSFLTTLFSLSSSMFFILNFISHILKRNIDFSRFLVMITVNEAFILFVYPIFQLIANGDWGYYGDTPSSWHNLYTNLYIHIIYPVLCLVFFVFTEKEKIVKVKDLLKIAYPFLTVWFITVKVLGECCYSFRWFPYPIFSTDAIWMALFGTLNNYNAVLAHLMFVAIIVSLVFIYYLVSRLIVAIYNKLVTCPCS